MVIWFKGEEERRVCEYEINVKIVGLGGLNLIDI